MCEDLSTLWEHVLPNMPCLYTQFWKLPQPPGSEDKSDHVKPMAGLGTQFWFPHSELTGEGNDGSGGVTWVVSQKPPHRDPGWGWKWGGGRRFPLKTIGAPTSRCHLWVTSEAHAGFFTFPFITH